MITTSGSCAIAEQKKLWFVLKPLWSFRLIDTFTPACPRYHHVERSNQITYESFYGLSIPILLETGLKADGAGFAPSPYLSVEFGWKK